jgi:hypothetical protein
VFYQSAKPRALTTGQRQNVIAGTERRLFVQNPAAQGFVSTSRPSAKRRPSPLIPRWIYAAAVGAAAGAVTGDAPSGPAPAAHPRRPRGTATMQWPAPPPPNIPSMSPTVSGGSRGIGRAGVTRSMVARQRFVYAIAFDAQGNATLGREQAS